MCSIVGGREGNGDERREGSKIYSERERDRRGYRRREREAERRRGREREGEGEETERGGCAR